MESLCLLLEKSQTQRSGFKISNLNMFSQYRAFQCFQNVSRPRICRCGCRATRLDRSARASTPEGAAREQRRWLKQRADRAAEKQRNQRDDASDECTFTPRICEKSVDMVASRLQRLRITGNLYDHLYADAMRRQDRMVEAEQWLPKEATFSPEIGLEHYRPSPDADRAALLERLSSSRGSGR
jgi:hypothetical protein